MRFEAESRYTQRETEAEEDCDLEPQTSKQEPKLSPEEARELVLHHLEDIRDEARHFMGGKHDFSLDDLFQYGVVGAMEACQKFDPAKNYRFFTYAQYWVRRAIKYAIIDGGKGIRLTYHVHDDSYKLKACQHDLGRKGTVEELHLMSGLPPSTIKNTLEAKSLRVTSLQKKLRHADNELRTLQDIIPDEKSPNPESRCAEDETIKRVRESLEILLKKDPLAGRILQLQFGMGNGSEMSMAAIGKELKRCEATIKLHRDRGIQKFRAIYRQGHKEDSSHHK